ncbi:ABC transporter substrate-binding protein [Pseudactinotalea sp.]|uniref:ABC transporter substrate-binding protein n=1 Tax=Pseudactinotalea sp. TaxID=1926260 RepID=UPI003B3A69A9
MTRPIPDLTRRSLLLGGAGLPTAGFLASCAADDGAGGTAEGGTTAGGEPTTGGTLRFAIANDPASVNPQGGGSGNDARYVTRQLVDSLLYQDPDTGDLHPWLATEWSVSEDSTEFTFTLRDDVTFSDGTPLTAQIVLDNFDDVLEQGANANYAIEHLAGYLGGDATDEVTLTVRFDRPSIPFLQALTEPIFGPLAPATLAASWDERTTGIIGTGAFTLGSYVKDTEVVLARRDGYVWGPSLADNTGEAYLDEVVFQIIPEASVRTGAISSDQVDVIGGVPPQDQETLTASGFTIVERANPGVVFGLTPYTGRPIVSDLAVRTAFALSLVRTDLRDATLNDSYKVATSVLASSTPGWADLSDHIPEDTDEAARLLDEAGWTLGADGIRVKDGEPLHLVIWWSDNFVANQSALELLQAQVRTVGFDVELRTGDATERQAAVDAGELDFSYGNLSRADADILRTQFHIGENDVNKVPDPDLNGLLEQQSALTGAERDAVVDEAITSILDNVYYVPTFELTSVLALTTGVAGVAFAADSRLSGLSGAFLTTGA